MHRYILREKYASAKAPIGVSDIIFIYSRHVEVVVKLEKQHN
jgi:hypothetical protein